MCEEIHFAGRARNGPYRRFHESGAVAIEGRNDGGWTAGVWIHFDEAGNEVERVDVRRIAGLNSALDAEIT